MTFLCTQGVKELACNDSNRVIILIKYQTVFEDSRLQNLNLFYHSNFIERKFKG